MQEGYLAKLGEICRSRPFLPENMVSPGLNRFKSFTNTLEVSPAKKNSIWASQLTKPTNLGMVIPPIKNAFVQG